MKPTIPDGTEVINYTVIMNEEVIFVGKSRYFGGDYEVDCSDFFDSYISKVGSAISSVSITVNFTFDDNPTVRAYTISWQAELMNLPEVNPSLDGAYLNLVNSGFITETSLYVTVPLSCTNGILDGKTINRLEKVNYIDRYGDTHNGSMTNHYELECYVDPCWFSVTTGDDLEYEKLFLALQNSKITTLDLVNVTISGIEFGSNIEQLIGRVKDIEKIETYSSYSTDKKVPSYKITFEVYR